MTTGSLWLASVLALAGGAFAAERESVSASASSSAEGFPAGAAVDGERFSTRTGASWRGRAGESNWWWQVSFAQPRDIGAILQITGDHEFVLRNAPKRYVWQASRDGTKWFDLKETFTGNERRLYRLHRLRQKQRVQFLRLKIDSATGEFPVLREAEFFADPKATVPFPDWTIAVNTTHERTLPNHGQEFIPLARSCEDWAQLQAQQVWLDSFDAAQFHIEMAGTPESRERQSRQKDFRQKQEAVAKPFKPRAREWRQGNNSFGKGFVCHHSFAAFGGFAIGSQGFLFLPLIFLSATRSAKGTRISPPEASFGLHSSGESVSSASNHSS